MSTSRADRLAKLFETDSYPPPPEPGTSHIADTEIISTIRSAQQPWTVPTVAQVPRRLTKPPPRTGRDFDQLTSSDDDEYVRAFKKVPSARPENATKSRKKTSTSTQFQRGGGPTSKPINSARHDAMTGDKDDLEKDDGFSKSDKDGHPLVGRFCLFTLVTKFCYKYMDDPNDRVSKHFFASGKIWKRTWDIYYIHPPASLYSKPILLVPEKQVRTLLDEINSAFRISIKIPRDPFSLAFYQDGTPSPTKVGVSHSRETVAEMEQQIPPPSEDYDTTFSDAEPELERSFQRFKQKMERAIAANKKKNVAVKKIKAKDRLVAHVNWCEALRRGQRYLGLRPIDCRGKLPLPDASLSWDEQQEFEREQKLKYGHILEPLDLEKPAPQPFDRDVVFVSIDVEAFERAHNLITEVGISTLDTADIKSLAPGNGGSKWMQCIRSRHFRISNYDHLRNTTFCTGDPEKFLFGDSEFVNMDEIGEIVDSCFEPPYSADFVHDGAYRPAGGTTVTRLRIADQLRNVSLETREADQGNASKAQSSTYSIDVRSVEKAEQDVASDVLPPSEHSKDVQITDSDRTVPSSKNRSTEDTQPIPNSPSAPQKCKRRNIILIGHNVDSDLQYLSNINSQVFHKPPSVTYPQPLEPETPLRQCVLESLDTANLYQVWKREANTTSLAKVLVGVERTGWHLHNGGNDARYTLEALIGILVRARVEEGMPKTTQQQQQQSGKDQEGEEEGGEEEAKLVRTIREKQAAVERDERENAAMWHHAVGSQYTAGILPDPLQQTQHQDDPAGSPASPPPSTSAAPDPAYAWSSHRTASRDGGEPKGFYMPPPRPEKVDGKDSGNEIGMVRPSSKSKRRDRIERLQNEGVIGRPCDWAVGGTDGW